MAEGSLLNLAESLVTHLASTAINEIALARGFKARLIKLQQTVNSIKDMLLDAEEKQLQDRAVRGWVQRLKVVVYEADDLFDEFSTMVLQKKAIPGNKFTREVTTLFSSNNQIKVAFSISHKIKRIKERLDEIDQDGKRFEFVVRPYKEKRAVHSEGRETHSHVDVEDVVGREDGKKDIVEILDKHKDQRICVVPIVGMGGLGKTTLAQLVYNELQNGFELSMWVCVSDDFDLKEMVRKILMSATNIEPQNLELDQLQKELRSQINGKKYLLVLDDVWNENVEKWHDLRALLKVGMEGSKILVTTRLMKVAKIMGTIPDPYVLNGLAEEESFILFNRMAFPPGQEENSSELLSIGKEIVGKCANNPLAIRVLGSFLYGEEDKTVWLNMKDRSLADIPENDNRIMAILEISYNHLNSSLKNCFAYCALFQKDFELKKKTLINLWMAQGFVIPTHRSKSLEEAGEEYFITLLQRGFFQNVTKDAYGNIESCQMHDLFHDLAIKVAGFECKVAKFEEMEIGERTNHLSIGYCLTSSMEVPSIVLNLKLLRTFLLPQQKRVGSNFSKTLCDQLLSGYRCLRVLDLHSLELEALPSSIGKLIHLRYLDLSQTSIQELPHSITNLQNLQTLYLNQCRRLAKLPVDLGKLTNLRTLDVSECHSLTEMPSGLGGLTSLHSLPFLRVNRKLSRGSTSETLNAQLGDLKNIINLGGSLAIKIQGVLKDPAYESIEANMGSKDRLTELCIYGDSELYYNILDNPERGGLPEVQGRIERNPPEYYEKLFGSKHDEAVLEGLKPHSNLKKLEIGLYKGGKFPSWAQMDNLHINLPNLVEITLDQCLRCQKVPSFSQLHFLKLLILGYLPSVEYMEGGLCEFPQSHEKKLFFPSLETLALSGMENLKGWWKEVGDDVEVSPVGSAKVQLLSSSNSFSNLSKLVLLNCPNLKSMPHCPNVQELVLVKVNENLSVLKTTSNFAIVNGAQTPSTSVGSSSKLKTLSVTNVGDLISLPKDCVSNLSTLLITGADILNTSSIGGFFRSSNSLRSLYIFNCEELISISRGLEDLTMLKTLRIWRCGKLDMQANDVNDEMPWKALRNLHSLEIELLPKLTALPSGFQHLTNLRSLKFKGMYNLEALPEWISCFSSLEHMELTDCPKLSSLPEGFRKLTNLSQLIIDSCPGLTERCRGPIGEDWPKIQHIPFCSVLTD